MPQTDARRVDAHVEAESIALERLLALWILTHEGPETHLNGVPVLECVARFERYEPPAG